MKYIIISRFKGKAICGEINLQYGTKCECNENGYITYNNKIICYNHSQNAFDYFSSNDDGKGLERGKLVKNIMSTLAKPDVNHQKRWNKIWNDSSLFRFKRTDIMDDDTWLWNFDFFNANIFDLQYIYNLIKEV